MPLDLIKKTDQLTLALQLGEDHQTRKDAYPEKTSPRKEKNQKTKPLSRKLHMYSDKHQIILSSHNVESKQLVQAIILSISRRSMKSSMNSGRLSVIKPDANMTLSS